MSSNDSSTPVRSTRSGRAVKAPKRYEPDPTIVLEDDFSDEDSVLSEDGYEEELETVGDEDEEFDCVEEMEEESESEDEDLEDEEDDEDEKTEIDTCEEEDEDVLDWDRLTENASQDSDESDED